MRKKIDATTASGLQEITIYLYPNGDDTKIRAYCKTHTSSMKFTVGRVLALIHEAFMCAVDEIFDGDSTYLHDRGLCGFTYNPKTRIVVPITES
jgi:hypothetical protein